MIEKVKSERARERDLERAYNELPRRVMQTRFPDLCVFTVGGHIAEFRRTAYGWRLHSFDRATPTHDCH